MTVDGELFDEWDRGGRVLSFSALLDRALSEELRKRRRGRASGP